MDVRVEIWLGHEIRFVEMQPNDWWAIAKDVTKALGIKNTSMAVNGNPKTKNKGLRESEKGICSLGGEQEWLVINELGIYRLIFRSNKPEAEAFQDWVFGTLKVLRQTAGLERFQIFRMLGKEHLLRMLDKEAAEKLSASLKEPKRADFMVMIHPVHRRLAELHHDCKSRLWTLKEAQEIRQCMQVSADLVRDLDWLKQLSQHAYEMGDTDWQHGICAQIDELTAKMDVF